MNRSQNRLKPGPLSPHTVDVYRVELSRWPRRHEVVGHLDPSEISAVAAMAEPHRSRKLWARAALRLVLAGYLSASPAAIRFTCGPYGKPVLDCATALDGLEFNLSRSGSSCLIAVTRAGLVGVDIEVVASVPHVNELARRFFAPVEAAALAAHGEERGVRQFLRYWTAKEAYAKAKGVGLHLPLDSLIVPAAFAHNDSVVVWDADGERWLLIRAESGAGTVATLAVRSPHDRLTVVEATVG